MHKKCLTTIENHYILRSLGGGVSAYIMLNQTNQTKQPTIYDISQKAGVSIATVSRVLNGHSKVSEKTKGKVLDVIRELGYEPNAFARGLGIGSTKTIGILCADVADIYFGNAVSFLERELRKKGFDFILNCTGHNYENKCHCMRMMESRKVDAVILVGSHYIEKKENKNKYIYDTASRIPVMIINGFLEGENIFCTISDDYEAFYDASCRLLEKGCRRILFLYREMTYSRNKKFEGYCDALKKYNIDYDAQLTLLSNHKILTTKNILKNYYNDGHHFDAIIACDDELALGALKFAQEMELRVPEQVSIIGCNNSILSICCQPELSSIDNKCEFLCANTVAMLMRVLNKEEVSQKVVVSTKYVERHTTRK